MVKDYGIELTYYEGKANIIIDALSRKLSHSLGSVVVSIHLLEEFSEMGIEMI